MSKPVVGDALPPFTVEEIEPERVVEFMELMRDTNPIHVDAELAARLGFRGPVAQGPASLAYVINMLAGWRPEAFLERLEFRFREPVTVGDTVTATGVVEAVDGAAVACAVSLRLQTGEEALTGTAVLRLPPEC